MCVFVGGGAEGGREGERDIYIERGRERENMNMGGWPCCPPTPGVTKISR